MAYLPQFRNDVFVSYRRASNESQDRWVDQFCDSVRAQLNDLVGDVRMWRDTAELRAGDYWRPEIADAVDSSAIFLALISRTYFDSDECRKEFDRFLGRLKSPEGSEGRKLVPIFKHPPKPDQELPAELDQIGRHEFFALHPKPWRELDPKRDEDDYKERLGRVVFDLMEALEAMQQREKKKARGKVFVAGVGPELLQERDRVRADLRQRGYAVVPEREYLWNAADLREKIDRDLSQALLAVHLVSREASLEPLTPARARLQLELASAAMAAQGKPPPLVWIQGGEATDASAQGLVDYIENDLANAGVDYLTGGIEELKTLIVDLLPKPEPEPRPKPREVALLIEEADIADAAPLRELLADRLGIDAKLVKFSGCSAKDPARLAKTLAAARQCLIFWGRQEEEWLQDLLDSTPLAGHLGRERLAIVAAAPASAEKAAFRSPNARLVRGASADGEAELRAFLDAGNGS